MKKLLLLTFLVGSAFVVFSQMTLSNNSQVIVADGSYLIVNDINNTSGTITNNGTITINGDVTNNSGGLFDNISSGSVTFSGITAQEITGVSTVHFYGPLGINNTNGVSINGSLAVYGKLSVYGTLNITPNADATIIGDTYLDASEAIVIQSDATGTGSFIDNGTITYGTGGSAKVQTYLSNNAAEGFFHFHLVGPTVNTTGSGVQLSAFNVANGNTFAYNYDVTNDAWTNFSALTDDVYTAQGIGMSTDDATPHIMEMTGNLVTGAINSETMSTSGSGNNLLSNPYPSSIYWNDIIVNNSNVDDQVYIFDPEGGNYIAYGTGSSGTLDFNGYIQIGQGFFVEATDASAFTFDNDDRHHSNEAFYKKTTFTNRLDVRASGNGFTDGILVHFHEEASSGYNPDEDAEKKMSYNENATQMWSVNEDNSKLSINALPIELLSNNYSIPLSFTCNSSDYYSLNFLGLDSFETGTEIWLEDKIAGGEWISVNLHTDYSFTASADDPEDRFVIHFFGPTAIDENGNPVTVDIYSYKKYAYVRNNTNETIKKIGIYTLSGKLLFETEDITFKNSKYYVSDRSSYYVVQVITDKNVYTEKVFISK